MILRVGLALGIVVIAVLCLASAWLAAAIGITTAIVVAVDSVIVRDPAPAKPSPDHLTVDLRRRR